ncbi:MAG: hypothetical protein HXY30_19790, partial [Pseudorhodoplanes sp.]|nr:hypothetical protein [Pseudorhodoplanes sp.]
DKARLARGGLARLPTAIALSEEGIRRVFDVSPKIVLLPAGSLAKEFEFAVKAPESLTCAREWVLLRRTKPPECPAASARPKNDPENDPDPQEQETTRA